MDSSKSFKDLRVWQDAIDLTVEVYTLLRNLKDFGYRDQITRACISISNNIAEGQNRGSRREFIRFLHIARGSKNEVISMVHLGRKLGYLQDIDIEHKFTQLSTRILRLIQALN